MRLIEACFLLLAAPAHAEVMMMPAERVLSVYGISEYGENDWNGDDHSDLAVLAISDSGDAIDLIFATSDPETGILSVTDVAAGILPYDPARTTLTYYIGPAHEAYQPEIMIRDADLGHNLTITTERVEDDPVLLRVAAFRENPESGRSDMVCEINYLDLVDFEGPGTATIIGPDGDEITYEPALLPSLLNWHLTDLPGPCVP